MFLNVQTWKLYGTQHFFIIFLGRNQICDKMLIFCMIMIIEECCALFEVSSMNIKQPKAINNLYVMMLWNICNKEEVLYILFYFPLYPSTDTLFASINHNFLNINPWSFDQKLFQNSQKSQFRIQNLILMKLKMGDLFFNCKLVCTVW